MDNLQVYNVYDEETANAVLELVKSIEQPRWVKRTELQPGRAVNNSKCSYYYCSHTQMKKEDKDYLISIAPKYENFFLSEIAVNRYEKGDYIGQHRDRHDFRRNLVVSLQSGADGLLIDDTETFIKDELGQGVLIEGIGPVHSVPEAKDTRYSLIFLYE